MSSFATAALDGAHSAAARDFNYLACTTAEPHGTHTHTQKLYK